MHRVDWRLRAGLCVLSGDWLYDAVDYSYFSEFLFASVGFKLSLGFQDKIPESVAHHNIPKYGKKQSTEST